MLRLVIAIAVIALLWWFLFSFTKASAAQRQQLLTRFLLYAVAGGILLLVVTGRAPWFFAIIGAAIPWIQRLLVLKNAWHAFKPKTESVGSPGRQSTVTSAYLQMSLDHDSGSMDGKVIQGQFAGAQLSTLQLNQLQVLLTECAADTDSQNLLRAYLNFRFPGQWHERDFSDQNPPGQVSQAPMSRAEALAILGLEVKSSEAEIIQAHKKLMQKVHPDRGGSAYLAAKINQAKKTLLSSSG